jgi:hypothetical protein
VLKDVQAIDQELGGDRIFDNGRATTKRTIAEVRAPSAAARVAGQIDAGAAT